MTTLALAVVAVMALVAYRAMLGDMRMELQSLNAK